jgi:hypothetical protein
MRSLSRSSEPLDDDELLLDLDFFRFFLDFFSFEDFDDAGWSLYKETRA